MHNFNSQYYRSKIILTATRLREVAVSDFQQNLNVLLVRKICKLLFTIYLIKILKSIFLFILLIQNVAVISMSTFGSYCKKPVLTPTLKCFYVIFYKRHARSHQLAHLPNDQKRLHQKAIATNEFQRTLAAYKTIVFLWFSTAMAHEQLCKCVILLMLLIMIFGNSISFSTFFHISKV